MNILKIGMSGADENFYNMGYNNTAEIPFYLKELDLDCFEYPCGRGIRLSQSTAQEIRNVFDSMQYEISLHAPYFINFANPDEQKMQNTFNYLYDSCVACHNLGGKRVVFHPGSYLNLGKEQAFELCLQNFDRFLLLYGDYLIENDIYVCPETMGKSSQVGTVEEVALLAKMHKNVLPCVDFGHVNARYQGILKNADDYKKVIDELSVHLDDLKVKNMHVHFSKIEYTQKGEKKHLTFEDTTFGPEFEPLAEVIFNNKLTPYIVSESAGTQGKDAQYMKKVFTNLMN